MWSNNEHIISMEWWLNRRITQPCIFIIIFLALAPIKKCHKSLTMFRCFTISRDSWSSTFTITSITL
jgi:hypothetical protein